MTPIASAPDVFAILAVVFLVIGVAYRIRNSARAVLKRAMRAAHREAHRLNLDFKGLLDDRERDLMKSLPAHQAHSDARAGLIALQVLAGGAVMLAGAFLFWAALTGLGALAQAAAAALGISPTSAVYSQLLGKAELWRSGAMAVLWVMAVAAVAMAAFAAGQALVAFRGWVFQRRA